MGLALMAYRLGRTVPQEPSHLVSVFNTWSYMSALPTSSMSLRSSQSGIRLPRPRTNMMRHSPLYVAFSTWNSLPTEAKISRARVKAAFSFP